MANELQAVAQGDALTIYAVIRRQSDNYVWSTVAGAFVVWVNGDVGNYDVPLTNAGGDLYAADFPSAIAANVSLRIHYYQQAGGTPAITDLLLKSDPLFWNGSSLTSVPGAVGTIGCQLTDLATVKRYLELTDATYNDVIQQIINQQSARVNRIVGRTFCASDYVEWHRLEYDARFSVKQFPVIHVARIASGPEPAISVDYVGSDIRALMGVTETGVRLTSTTAAGATTTTALTFASNATFSAMATAINAVAGWDASLTSANTDGLSSNLYREAGLSLKQGTRAVRQYLSFPSEDIEFAVISHESGLIAIDGAAWDSWGDSRALRKTSGLVMVEYRAGYETIPQDVMEVVTELAAAAFKSRGSSAANAGNIKSESLGDYSYTIGENRLSAVADLANLSGEHQSVLAPYMPITVGGMY